MRLLGFPVLRARGVLVRAVARRQDEAARVVRPRQVPRDGGAIDARLDDALIGAAGRHDARAAKAERVHDQLAENVAQGFVDGRHGTIDRIAQVQPMGLRNGVRVLVHDRIQIREDRDPRERKLQGIGQGRAPVVGVHGRELAAPLASRAEEEGLGVGLPSAVAEQIVGQHGGDLRTSPVPRLPAEELLVSVGSHGERVLRVAMATPGCDASSVQSVRTSP